MLQKGHELVKKLKLVVRRRKVDSISLFKLRLCHSELYFSFKLCPRKRVEELYEDNKFSYGYVGVFIVASGYNDEDNYTGLILYKQERKFHKERKNSSVKCKSLRAMKLAGEQTHSWIQRNTSDRTWMGEKKNADLPDTKDSSYNRNYIIY